MYKTVRHGENSLQYKILAQQEEGLTNVKCKKYRRSRTTGIIAVILLLICGVVASAVLVPLILTNDFITLTGTFQKFSVSTLRRTHSGNHIVVIAKKPHGWNSSKQSVVQPVVKTTNASLGSIKNAEVTAKNESTLSTSTTSQPESHQKELKQTTARQSSEGWDDRSVKNKLDVPTTSTEIHKAVLEFTEEKETSSFSATKEHQNLNKEATLVTSTAELPFEYERHKWNFKTPTALINWSKNGLLNHPLSSVLGGLFVINCFIVFIVILMKRIQKRKSVKQKESSESTEDKARLLKPSSRAASDEE